MSYYTIERGDTVEVNLTMHTDLGKPNRFNSGVVTSVQEGDDEVEVLFPDCNEPKLISVKQILDIEREYKVLTITDNVERATNKPVTIIELSRIDKLYHFNGTTYNIIKTYSETVFDLFIYYEDSNVCIEISENPGQNAMIKLTDYYTKILNYKGKIIPAFYEDD